MVSSGRVRLNWSDLTGLIGDKRTLLGFDQIWLTWVAVIRIWSKFGRKMRDFVAFDRIFFFQDMIRFGSNGPGLVGKDL